MEIFDSYVERCNATKVLVLVNKSSKCKCCVVCIVLPEFIDRSWLMCTVKYITKLLKIVFMNLLSHAKHGYGEIFMKMLCVINFVHINQPKQNT